MYISLGTAIALTIALGVSLFLVIITTYANYLLLRENKYLKSRLRAWRESCKRQHVEVPF
jgi:protein-S-isoprenylcysteine O-methyltransferase Ste14